MGKADIGVVFSLRPNKRSMTALRCDESLQVSGIQGQWLDDHIETVGTSTALRSWGKAPADTSDKLTGLVNRSTSPV